jgi:MFS family permease
MTTGLSAATDASTAGPRRAERLLVPAAFITCLGNSIQLTAAALLVLQTQRSTLAVGWLFIAVAVPQVALSVFFGRLADRFDRRTLCVICDLTSAAAALALPIWLLAGGGANAAAYLSNFVLAVVAAMFMPASNALIKERIAPQRIGPFNANFEIATQAGTLLSAAVGGFMVQLFGVRPLFVFNAITFLASAVCMYLLGRRPAHVPAAEAEAAAAAGATPPRQPLALLAMLYAVGNIVITMSNTLLVVVVIVTFQRRAGIVGVVDAMAGIGIMIAAALYKRVSTRVSTLRMAFIGYLACAAIIALEPINVWLLVALIPFSGMFFGLARISARTMLMSAVAESRAGRVFGATQALGLGLSAIMTVLISRLADQTRVSYAFFVLAAVVAAMVVVVVLLLRARAVRQPAPVLEAAT